LDIGAVWDLIALEPMLNSMVWLSTVLFGSFGLTIIALTVLVRGLMYPLTIKQLHATRAMQALQPRLKELQKKYAKDRQKLGQEQMKLYRESGVSPAGCVLPMLIQLPIWIALYQAIIRVLAVTPEDFLNLSGRLYDWPVLYSALPLDNTFLWMDLSVPDFFLAILVGATMWAQQKMVSPAAADPKQAAQGRTMLVVMPLLFMFFAITFPSGLALYWVASAVITIIIQYFVTGWGSLAPSVAGLARMVSRDRKYTKRITEVEKTPADVAAVETESLQADITQEEVAADERGGEKRKDGGRGYPDRLRGAKRKPRRGKGRRSGRR
jgi:YidC/Oxa1 family membrane protein insertase